LQFRQVNPAPAAGGLPNAIFLISSNRVGL
jgi:hypothetical protein